MFSNRLEGCSYHILHDDALYEKKILLRHGCPRCSSLFFDRPKRRQRAALGGEQPWLHARGITAALDYADVSFDDLLMRSKQAAVGLILTSNHGQKNEETL